MADKTTFKVLSKAPFVAGLRNPGEAKTLRLTEDQARYPLINGEIERDKMREKTTPANKTAGETGKGK